MSDSDHTWLIGVDGGGTGCRAAIGTLENGVLAQAEGGRANATSDPELAIMNVASTVQAAAEKAGVPLDNLKNSIAHLGLAGVMTPADERRIASALPYKNATITDDRPTTVTGALGGQDGFLLSIGTGTIVAAKRDKDFSYIGGWGFQISDQASGAWLGRAALERTILCHDGLAPHSDLTRALMAEFNDDPNAIVTLAASAKPGDYAAFARQVVSTASAEDPWALAMMADGAAYLMQGLSILGFRPGDVLCLTGGVGPHYARYLPSETLAGQITSRGEALDGAFQLAKSRAENQQGRRQ